MCDCITNLEKRILEEHKPEKGKVLKASFVSAGIIFGVKEASLRATGKIELTLDCFKKPKEVNVVYSYCPFCGTKYSDI